MDQVVPAAEIVAAIDAVWPLVAPDGGGRRDSAPAESYRYADGAGRVGVIASVTRPFCESCDRIRLTAEGQLRNCLFSVRETDLRAILRGGGSDDDLAAAIEAEVGRKWAGHSIGQVHFIRPGPEHEPDRRLSPRQAAGGVRRRGPAGLGRLAAMSDRGLTHLDPLGRARMVDVTPKEATHRRAIARCKVFMKPETTAKVASNAITKGDVLGAARIAGIQAAKRTADMIPLCHPLLVGAVTINFTLGDDFVEVETQVETVDRTGVEMEAMTACAVAALTIYDMCKSADRSMVIGELALWEKTGGRSGHWRRPTGDLADPAGQHRRQPGRSTSTPGSRAWSATARTDPLELSGPLRAGVVGAGQRRILRRRWRPGDRRG